MIPLSNLFQILIKATTSSYKSGFACSMLFLLFSTWEVSAQTVSWSDSFKQGLAPTTQQCENWTNFLNQLGGKSFASVKFSGSNAETSFVITDAAAADQLAQLLYNRTPGSVTSGNHTWTVTQCNAGGCNTMSTALSVDGNTSECSCDDRYTIRPHSINETWGGFDVASSCNAPDQSMSLEFYSGVSISANGPTTLCPGGSVVLTANSSICEAPLQYLWNNGATTQSITVTETGNYYVTVSGGDACKGISSSVAVNFTDVSVEAVDDLIYCAEPVQLSALGKSTGGAGEIVNEVCVFNAPGPWGDEDDCVFNTTVCLEGNVERGNSRDSTVVSYSNPVKLNYKVYYSAQAIITFRFKLNKNEIGSWVETKVTGVCDTQAEGKFPRTFTFTESDFKQYWNEGRSNVLTVEIETIPGGILLAGIIAEVVTSKEKYLWSPATGLDNASIRSPKASPEDSTQYTVTYTDANGCTATDHVSVDTKCDSAPIALCKELIVELTDNCEVALEASAFNAGSTGVGPLKFSISPAGPYSVGLTNVLFTVTDANNVSSTCNASIKVVDKILPSIATPSDFTVKSGPGACSATMTLTAPQAMDNCQVASVTHDQVEEISSTGEKTVTFPFGPTTVTWTAKDNSGNTTTTTQTINVTNGAPVITSVLSSAPSVGINNPVTLAVTYYDENVSTASIDWGDNSTPHLVNAPGETFEVQHSYSAVGFYSVTVTITDHCGAIDNYVYERITVVNKGGSVTGDGWFDSKPGYHFRNDRVAGKANFRFEAKYRSSSAVPTGNITFKFKAGKVDFRSTQLDWLMVEDDRATLTGSGKLNGTQGYSILISVVDVQLSDAVEMEVTSQKDKKPKKTDKIRVKISDPSGNIVYDTQRDAADDALATNGIGGGSIGIENTSTFVQELENATASYFGSESTTVYPNPFVDHIDIQFNTSSTEDVLIQVIDLGGRIIASSSSPVSDDGYYSMDVPEEAPEGIYILTIKQGQRVEYLRVVRK